MFFIKIVILFGCFISLPFSVKSQEPIMLEGNAQGTTYHITYFDTLNRNLKSEIEKILHDFDLSVSTYIPNSIISKINANEKQTKLDAYFTTCFNKAKEVWANTNGAFDPTVYPLVNAYGFGPGKKQIIKKEVIDSLMKFVGFDLINLKGKRIIKKDKRVSLDFNAFAQGYSVDVISNFLISKNMHSFIVEIGGEVYAKGLQPNKQNWTVGIEQPIDNTETDNPLKAIVKLDGIAVATSGNYRRFIIENGVKYHHHIDPKTGYPTKNNLLSVSVFAKDCITADATATGFLVMGFDKTILFLKQHTEMQAYLIYSDQNGNYQTYQTEGLQLLLSTVED